jgi:hypothetical protein
MKKTTLILSILLFTAICANSQITKGYWLVGGNASLSFDEQLNSFADGSSAKRTLLELSPNIGYFLTDQLATGAKINIQGVYYKYIEGSNGTNYTFGPFIRYYFLKPEKLINVFVETSFLYGINHRPKYEGFYEAHNNYVYKYNGVIGTSIFLNDVVSINFSLDYTRTTYDDGSQLQKNNDITFGIGFQIFLIKK